MKTHRATLLILSVIALLAFGAPAQTNLQGPIKVFILAGQSNMEGYGGLHTLNALSTHPTQASLLKKIKNGDGSFVVREDVFIYYQRGEEQITATLTAGQGVSKDRMGPELTFGIALGDYYAEPVLLIKTAWGGKDLYCDFRPPSAGKPAYEIPGEPREMGAAYRQMIAEVHQCLDHLASNFPQFKGRAYELCGLVWFQGWNDLCAEEKIRAKVFAEYAHNFACLAGDVRAEFKAPRLPVVVGEVGVDGEVNVGPEMAGLRAAQAKIASLPELAGTVEYVRTAPCWYAELDLLPRKLEAEENRVKTKITAQIKTSFPGKPEALDAGKLNSLVSEALEPALAVDAQYQQVKAEHDQHISHWECHYWGSARVYALVGDRLGQAMIKLLKTK